jgi:hypothetical protein
MQKSLSFNKGITTSPSDLLSDDSELSASRGLIFRNGEMQPLRQAATFGQTDHRLLYIHKGADYANAITYDGTNLYWGVLKSVNGRILDKKPLYDIGNVSDITSVGNTLVVATDKGLCYILYKGDKYVKLGTELPKYRFTPRIYMITNLGLGGTKCVFDEMVEGVAYLAHYKDGKFTGCEQKFAASTPSGDTVFYHHRAKSERKEDIQTAIQGHVAACIAKVKENNLFAFPFFVRCAMLLYDGTYTRITVPVACYPTVNRNSYFTPVERNGDNETPEFSKCFLYLPYYYHLEYRIEVEGLDDWKDIVKKFVVFATDDVLPFYIDKEWEIALPDKTSETSFRTLVSEIDFSGSIIIPGQPTPPVEDGKYHFDTTKFNARDVIVPTYKTEQQIIDELLAKTQFYKLFTVNVEGLKTNEFVRPYIAPNVVSTLTEQEQLPNDDYYGWTTMIPDKLLTYNKRINMLGVRREPYEGACFFTNATSVNLNKSANLKYYVSISTSKSMIVVSPKSDAQELTVADSWFFYPDPNAVEVVVWDVSRNRGIKIRLKAHPFLNGAYAFRHLPLENLMENADVTTPPTPTSSYELLDSQIFTSVVNNPFVFQASGDNTVGTGSILGIAANTEPISQGQFGQYPLIVFTTEGIYGLSVNSEGLYSASYPISREVCNNPESITPTGNVVYFTSDKGLMAVSGGTVRCVSPQLSGANPPYSDATDSFLTFVRNAFLAYDYRDSLLFIYNVSYDYAYVYNLLDGTFATVSLGTKSIQRSVSNYPDTLLQDADNNVYSFSKIPVAQDDTQTYSGTFTTRPLKLGSSIQLKTIHQIVHLFNSADGTLTLNVYASNDCRNWTELHSLHGKPWKYYRFSYTLSNISASDTFAGTVIDFAPRFTNKIR